MNTNIKHLYMSPQQLCLNDTDKMQLSGYESNLTYYDKLIKEYKEAKLQEKIKLAMFVIERINEMDGIEKYKQPGSFVLCGDLVFVCNHDLKFQLANLEDEI